MASGRRNDEKTYPVGGLLFHRIKGTEDWVVHDKSTEEGKLGPELARFLKGAPARKFCEEVNKARTDGKSIDTLVNEAVRVYDLGAKAREQKEQQKQNALNKAAKTTPNPTVEEINPVAVAAASLEETVSTTEEISNEETISNEGDDIISADALS